jgi:hypothetical protein
MRILRDRGHGTAAFSAAERSRHVGLGHCVGGGRAAAGLGCESEPGSSLRTGPTGGSRLSTRERKERRERCRLGWEERDWAGWAAWGRKKEERLLGWALREEKERGEKERGSGPGQKRKRGRKRNAFERI